MRYGPDIPSVEHEVFPNPPLKAMLGQIRFPPVLKINDLGALAGFQDAIRDEFPEFAPEQQFNLVLGAGGPQNASVSSAYRFSTADRAWSVLLSTEALTLEVAVGELYTNYEEFSARFRRAWEAARDHFRPTRITRQGLRYIDHLEGELEAGEWAAYINEELLGPLRGVFGSGLEQAVSELRFRRDDGILVFKHGILPSGPEGKKGYLLDFDYFSEEPSEDVSIEAVSQRFDLYHEVQYAFFRWCVTDQAIQEFRRGR